MNKQINVEASLHSAMAAAFAEIDAATKGATGQVGNQKYKYADIGAVIESIKPALINHGLYFTQRPEPSENGITIETVISHSGGEEVSLGKLFVPANKSDAQAFGSALTYARRYALVTAFGVPVEDDDGNAAREGQSRNGAVNPPAITEAQWKEISDLADDTGTDKAKMADAYGVSSLKYLSPVQYKDALGVLTKRRAAQKEAA